MMIQTQAIVLQIRPWSQTSHMVTWLTPDYGKITTSVKGAVRPKSAFLGQYDLFYTCDLLFYKRERGGVHAIRECTPIRFREALRHAWRQTAAAAYLVDLTAQATASHQETADIFALLTQALDTLTAGTCLPKNVILWYETHLLRLLGIKPDFTLCPLCHTPDQQQMRFSLASGRFLCPHLAKRQAGEATLTLPRSVQTLFNKFSQLTTPPLQFKANAQTITKKNRPDDHLLLGLSRFLGIFITFHIDVPSVVRRVTFEMLDSNHTQQIALPERCLL